VELKARFDEESNIEWARALEKEGVHVVYGLPGLKTHAKVLLVVRRENGGIRRYVHLATGNYNAITAQLYTDLGYLTCDDQIGADVTDLFNYLTGYSARPLSSSWWPHQPQRPGDAHRPRIEHPGRGQRALQGERAGG
jgi:polyphosphate kinase